jgi:hypothetical protein
MPDMGVPVLTVGEAIWTSFSEAPPAPAPADVSKTVTPEPIAPPSDPVGPPSGMTMPELLTPEAVPELLVAVPPLDVADPPLLVADPPLLVLVAPLDVAEPPPLVELPPPSSPPLFWPASWLLGEDEQAAATRSGQVLRMTTHALFLRTMSSKPPDPSHGPHPAALRRAHANVSRK